MNIRLSKIVLLPILLVAIISCLPVMASESSANSDIHQKIARLETLVEEQRVLYNIPGLSLVVVKDGQVIFSRGFGLKDIEKNESVTSSTIFPINSTSKAFTAVLAGMRVDDGVLNWDDPVTRYLPDYRFTQDGKLVSLTLRDLLSHRSGYGRNGTLWANPQIQPAEIIKAAPRAMPLSEYQKEYHYNNVMFLAAGMATAFDQSFKWSELLENRILEPLGMTDTTAVYADIAGDERLAQGYYWDDIDEKFRKLNAQNLGNIAPATGIYSNANDMAKWLAFIMASGQAKGKQLIEPSTLKETYIPTTEISPNFSYGLGWHVSEYNGQRLIEHSGNGEGFSGQVAILPESNIGFALLTNVSITPLQSGSITLVFDALLNALPSDTQTVPDYSAYFGDYIANFEPYDNTRFTFKMQGRKPALKIPGQTLYLLRHMDEDGKFYFEVTDQVAISFSTEPSGRVIGMTLHEAGEDLDLVVAKDESDVSPQSGGLINSEDFQRVSKILNIDSQKQALKAMGDVQLSGTLFQQQSGVSGDFRLTIDKNDFAIFQDFGKYGSIETRVSNGEGMNRRLRHSYELRGKYLEQALREHPLHFLYWDRTYSDFSIQTNDDSEDLITISLKSKALPEAHVTLNTKTSVVEKISFSFIDPVWGQYPRTISYKDYKLVAGVNIPHRIEIDDHETGVTVLRVEDVACILCKNNNL